MKQNTLILLTRKGGGRLVATHVLQIQVHLLWLQEKYNERSVFLG